MCIGFKICVSKFNQVGQIMCTQNHTIGEEYGRGWHPERCEPTKSPCSMLVVGAGPGGVEGARVLWKWVGGVVGTIAAPAVTVRIGRRRVILCSLALAGLSVIPLQGRARPPIRHCWGSWRRR
jgi:hypothetical protein